MSIGQKKEQQERLAKNSWLRYCLRGVAVFILIGLAISGFSIYKEYSMPPEEVVIRALEQTVNAPSYTYHSLCSRELAGKTEKLCEVWGEKNESSTHLVGSVDLVKAKFEIYQVNDRFYRQDALSKEWMLIEAVSEEATEKLLQEVDPLAVFQFGPQVDAEYLGKEKIGQANCRKYHIMAYNENAFLNEAWHDFFFTLWVDKDGYLRQAEVIAVSRNNEEQKLQMTVQFQQSPQYLEIKAPI